MCYVYRAPSLAIKNKRWSNLARFDFDEPFRGQRVWLKLSMRCSRGVPTQPRKKQPSNDREIRAKYRLHYRTVVVSTSTGGRRLGLHNHGLDPLVPRNGLHKPLTSATQKGLTSRSPAAEMQDYPCLEGSGISTYRGQTEMISTQATVTKLRF